MKNAGTLLAVLAFLLWFPTDARADAMEPRPPEQSSESEVKAEFVFNFLRFVEWPSVCPHGEGAPLIVGIVGDTPFTDTLANVVRGKTVRGRSVAVKTIESDADVQPCQTVFFATSDQQFVSSILAHTRTETVLTVGDDDWFARMGGVINFYTKDNRVKFTINPSAASRAGLRISSKLLRLATIVQDQSQPGVH